MRRRWRTEEVTGKGGVYIEINPKTPLLAKLLLHSLVSAWARFHKALIAMTVINSVYFLWRAILVFNTFYIRAIHDFKPCD